MKGEGTRARPQTLAVQHLHGGIESRPHDHPAFMTCSKQNEFRGNQPTNQTNQPNQPNQPNQTNQTKGCGSEKSGRSPLRVQSGRLQRDVKARESGLTRPPVWAARSPVFTGTAVLRPIGRLAPRRSIVCCPRNTRPAPQLCPPETLQAVAGTPPVPAYCPS